ncbi:hypothetical protein DEJ51_07885 [Streptomyces venezuelae]|uniref:Uncharacterized protein n=1 Tax=Streptomyces venezuelae TaxID=54571 RepID=A0A5P2DHF5_STRVZ|nr:hypothetical protein DEJ51_07885 [Streptomyces venezuelae]
MRNAPPRPRSPPFRVPRPRSTTAFHAGGVPPGDGLYGRSSVPDSRQSVARHADRGTGSSGTHHHGTHGENRPCSDVPAPAPPPPPPPPPPPGSPPRSSRRRPPSS